MGSGLSMSSVTKIKELANAREYSLALDILDSQDLTKSLNPQFLRLCGEIYTHEGRYTDARRLLIMAHRMAPESKRVIYSLVYLYLKLGYFELAEKYFDIYMSDADEAAEETNQLKYIYRKGQKDKPEELEELLSNYANVMDYDWSYELFLVYILTDQRDKAKVLSEIYQATYKNSEYSCSIQDILDGKLEADSRYYIFSEEASVDDDPVEEDIRQEEIKLLEADDLRINPPEAEITIMVDDNEEATVGSKRKLKKFLKEQSKLAEENSTGDSVDDTEETENSVTDEAATDIEERDSEPDNDGDYSADETEKSGRLDFLKKVFGKIKKFGGEEPEDEASADDEADSEDGVDSEGGTDSEDGAGAEAENDTDEQAYIEDEENTPEETSPEERAESEEKEAVNVEEFINIGSESTQEIRISVDETEDFEAVFDDEAVDEDAYDENTDFEAESTDAYQAFDLQFPDERPAEETEEEVTEEAVEEAEEEVTEEAVEEAEEEVTEEAVEETEEEVTDEAVEEAEEEVTEEAVEEAVEEVTEEAVEPTEEPARSKIDFPVFNVADIFITFGILIYIYKLVKEEIK